MLLELNNVEKDYVMGSGNKFKALKGIDISFNRGELVSIIGESGSGKSTLMNLIGGLDSKYKGTIELDGKDISKFKEKELDRYRKDKIGFVFQSFNLISHLSVLDNVTIAMILSNVKKSERIKKAEQLIKEVGLKDHMHKKPNQLSGGQKQRVAIARALINDPDIILADEPTGSLDSKTSEQILDIINKIAKKGKLVIMVTHSEKVAAISSRVVKISDGKIISDEKKCDTNSYKQEKDETKKGEKRKQNLRFWSAIKLALNNMKEKKSRNILVSLGASIGIMSIIIMLSIGNGVENYITNKMNDYVNPLVIEVNKKDETKEDTTTTNMPQTPMSILQEKVEPFTQDEIDELSKLENVVKIEKGYSAFVIGTNKIKYKQSQQYIQIFNTISSNITKKNIIKGDYPKQNEVLISENLLKEYDSEIIGKTINLELRLGEKVINKDVVVSGIYTTGSTNNQITSLFMNYDDLKILAEDNDYKIKPTTVYLVANSEDNTENISAKIEEMGYQGSKQEQLLDMFTEMLDVITYVLAAIAAISLLVSAIMILVVLYISVVERTKEIGVLKAIGARRKDIKTIFVSESFLIGLTSGVIGVVTAELLQFIINKITNKLYSVPVIAISPYYIIFGILVSIIVSMIAGLAPAGKAAKLDPVESLRRE